MSSPAIKEQIISQLDRLSEAQQRQVLDFTRSLARPRGTPGKVLIERMRNVQIDPADLEIMRQAIEGEFEKVDLDDWDLPPNVIGGIS